MTSLNPHFSETGSIDQRTGLEKEIETRFNSMKDNPEASRWFVIFRYPVDDSPYAVIGPPDATKAQIAKAFDTRIIMDLTKDFRSEWEELPGTISDLNQIDKPYTPHLQVVEPASDAGSSVGSEQNLT